MVYNNVIVYDSSVPGSEKFIEAGVGELNPNLINFSNPTMFLGADNILTLTAINGEAATVDLSSLAGGPATTINATDTISVTGGGAAPYTLSVILDETDINNLLVSNSNGLSLKVITVTSPNLTNTTQGMLPGKMIGVDRSVILGLPDLWEQVSYNGDLYARGLYKIAA